MCPLIENDPRDPIWKWSQVLAYAGVSKSTLRRMIERDEFPQPLKLTTSVRNPRLGWLRSTVVAWRANRKREADAPRECGVTDNKTAEPLILAIVGKLRPSSNIRDDLTQAGRVAALECAQTWDPDKGAWATWAYGRVQGAVLNEFKRLTGGIVGGRDTNTSAGQLDLGEPVEYDDGKKGTKIDNLDYSSAIGIAPTEAAVLSGSPELVALTGSTVEQLKTLSTLLDSDDGKTASAAKALGISERTARDRLSFFSRPEPKDELTANVNPAWLAEALEIQAKFENHPAPRTATQLFNDRAGTEAFDFDDEMRRAQARALTATEQRKAVSAITGVLSSAFSDEPATNKRRGRVTWGRGFASREHYHGWLEGISMFDVLTPSGRVSSKQPVLTEVERQHQGAVLAECEERTAPDPDFDGALPDDGTFDQLA